MMLKKIVFQKENDVIHFGNIKKNLTLLNPITNTTANSTTTNSALYQLKEHYPICKFHPYHRFNTYRYRALITNCNMVRYPRVHPKLFRKFLLILTISELRYHITISHHNIISHRRY